MQRRVVPAVPMSRGNSTAATLTAGVSPLQKAQDLNAGTDGRLRVHVAEDNEINQKVAVRMLDRLGFRIDVAADGREAVEMWQMLPYDLVFMKMGYLLDSGDPKM